jgi:hypothetical protein
MWYDAGIFYRNNLTWPPQKQALTYLYTCRETNQFTITSNQYCNSPKRNNATATCCTRTYLKFHVENGIQRWIFILREWHQNSCTSIYMGGGGASLIRKGENDQMWSLKLKFETSILIHIGSMQVADTDIHYIYFCSLKGCALLTPISMTTRFPRTWTYAPVLAFSSPAIRVQLPHYHEPW